MPGLLCGSNYKEYSSTEIMQRGARGSQIVWVDIMNSMPTNCLIFGIVIKEVGVLRSCGAMRARGKFVGRRSTQASLSGISRLHPVPQITVLSAIPDIVSSAW